MNGRVLVGEGGDLVEVEGMLEVTATPEMANIGLMTAVKLLMPLSLGEQQCPRLEHLMKMKAR
jgi:hypothetical protein